VTGSILSALVSAATARDPKGAVQLALDRDANVFDWVLIWLRSGLIDPSLSSFQFSQLMAEAHFLELPQLVTALEQLTYSAHFSSAEVRALLHTKAFGGADMHGQWLAGLDFSKADVTRAIFNGSNLSHALLTGADARFAQFKHAVLVRASFAGARCDGATFSHSNLSGADLSGCSLRDALFDHAKMESANLSRTDLHGCALPPALPGVNLSHTDLHGRDLSGYNLRAADLSRCVLTDTKLPLDLTGVSLAGAVLDSRDFTQSKLQNASFAGLLEGEEEGGVLCVVSDGNCLV
jgi:uncharacterized protein YjbI with pentapeptide repeats